MSLGNGRRRLDLAAHFILPKYALQSGPVRDGPQSLGPPMAGPDQFFHLIRFLGPNCWAGPE